MARHVWRPLLVLLTLVAVLLVARSFFVPADFGMWEQGYLYGFHRKGNEAQWQAFPAKYRFAADDCGGCHEQPQEIAPTPHAIIACENCHGPALNHPDEPAKLSRDTRRQLCLRCHFPLPYPTSDRAGIRSVDPAAHNPDNACVDCHNPHDPALEL